MKDGVHNDSIVLYRNGQEVMAGSGEYDEALFVNRKWTYFDLDKNLIYSIETKQDSNEFTERTLATIQEDDKNKFTVETFLALVGESDKYVRDS